MSIKYSEDISTTNWHSTLQCAELPDAYSNLIIQTLASLIDEFYSFGYQSYSSKTRLIKDKLCLLGKEQHVAKPEQKAYSNRISPEQTQKYNGPFKDREWMYDLHWYTELNDSHYMPTELSLAVECEWHKNRENRKISFSSVKYDFQKLLVTNATLRLLIFRVSNIAELREMNDSLKLSIVTPIYQEIPSS